jgi:hypothetical protein
LIGVMLSKGRGLAQVQKNESITIFAFFEEINPDEGNVNQTLILSVLKSDLDELAARPERFNEFKQRIKIVEY